MYVGRKSEDAHAKNYNIYVSIQFCIENIKMETILRKCK